MSSNSSNLKSATLDRKARLAQLRSLKRKQPYDETEPSNLTTPNEDGAGGMQKSESGRPSKRQSRSPPGEDETTTKFLSGRNYDAASRGPKLGFETEPGRGRSTLEGQAKSLAEQSKLEQEEETKNEKPLDLFKLQPKKPNWDLKRDLNKKLEILNPKTDNAIARLARERVERAQREARERSKTKDSVQVTGGSPNAEGADEGEEIGMAGAALVEATREMEREDAEEHEASDEDSSEAE